MDTKIVVSKSQHAVFEDGVCISKMPAATIEQLNFAKISSNRDNDAELKQSVCLLQELAKCTEDEAVTALYDCENDIQKAVDLLLDKVRTGRTDDWHTTGKKYRVKHTSVEHTDKSASNHIKEVHGSSKQKRADVNLHVQSKSGDHAGSNEPESGDTSVLVTANRGSKSFRSANSDSREIPTKGPKSAPRTPAPKDIRSGTKYSALCDGWDPYTEYGEWAGEAIEVVNSNASLARGLQTDAAPVEDLFVDINKSTHEASSTRTAESSVEAVSPKSAAPSDEDTLFISKATTRPPPPAFTELPDVPVFIVPEILSRNDSNLPFRFGGSCVSVTASSATDAALGTSENASINKPPESESRRYPTVSPQDKFRTYESTHLTTDTAVPNEKIKEPRQQSFTSNQFQDVNVTPKPQVPFQGDSALQPSAPYNSDRLSAQPGFLESSLKNYLLDNLPAGISKLSVANSKLENEPSAQFSLAASSQPQSINPPFSDSQPNSGAPIQQQHKTAVSHITTHGSFHGSQQPLASTASQQPQTAAMPPGMTHFISQFAPAAYHMFNLPGNSSSTPAVLEQLFHQQHRMFYDMHLHQQAATTAQSLLTSNSEGSATSKPQAVPGSVSHVTAAGAAMRPDILASAMGHAPQMLPTGHPFFSYPGFVLMNGYPNTFMNQPQSGTDGGGQNTSSPHGNTTLAQPPSQTSSSQTFPGMKPMAAAYDEFLDMKYGDPTKQVGYKSQSSTNFGNFQAHMDGAGPKLPTAHSASNNALNTGFAMNSGTGGSGTNQPFLPQYYQPGASSTAYLNAAVAAAQQQQQQQHHHSQQQCSSANNAVNQSNAGVVGGQGGGTHGQMHQMGTNHTQSLVMGTSGPTALHHAHHHPSQRPVMPHQH